VSHKKIKDTLDKIRSQLLKNYSPYKIGEKLSHPAMGMVSVVGVNSDAEHPHYELSDGKQKVKMPWAKSKNLRPVLDAAKAEIIKQKLDAPLTHDDLRQGAHRAVAHFMEDVHSNDPERVVVAVRQLRAKKAHLGLTLGEHAILNQAHTMIAREYENATGQRVAPLSKSQAWSYDSLEKSKKDFKVGSYALHQSHGIGKVIEHKEVNGQRFHVLEIEDGGAPKKVFTGVERLRPPMSKEEAAKVKEAYHAPLTLDDHSPEMTWNRRYRDLMEMTHGNEPMQQVKAIRQLKSLANFKDLSFGERKLLEQNVRALGAHYKIATGEDLDAPPPEDKPTLKLVKHEAIQALLSKSDEEHSPEDEDIYFHPSGPLGFKTSVSAGGKHLGEFSSNDEAEAAAREWTNRSNFWPNVWRVSDHGNYHLASKDFYSHPDFQQPKKEDVKKSEDQGEGAKIIKLPTLYTPPAEEHIPLVELENELHYHLHRAASHDNMAKLLEIAAETLYRKGDQMSGHKVTAEKRAHETAKEAHQRAAEKTYRSIGVSDKQQPLGALYRSHVSEGGKLLTVKYEPKFEPYQPKVEKSERPVLKEGESYSSLRKREKAKSKGVCKDYSK